MYAFTHHHNTNEQQEALQTKQRQQQEEQMRRDRREAELEQELRMHRQQVLRDVEDGTTPNQKCFT